MKITKIKKQNILKNNQTIETQKRNRINDPSSKMIINKRRSVSFSEKNILNETQIKKNISFDNSLELDYLNFSQMDLYKYNQSFEDDVFTPKTRILILKPEPQASIGFIVDEVKEVINIKEEEIDRVVTSEDKNTFIAGVGKHTKGLVSILNISAVLQDKEQD
jgi:hypothetical protein